MKPFRVIPFVAVCVSGVPVAADIVMLPSGIEAQFLDVITDAPGMGIAHRYRFVSPSLTPDRDYVTTEADMAHLCVSYALPRIEGAEPRPDAIVITLADRPVPFGATDPEAIQFFEAYTPQGRDCLWRDF